MLIFLELMCVFGINDIHIPEIARARPDAALKIVLDDFGYGFINLGIGNCGAGYFASSPPNSWGSAHGVMTDDEERHHKAVLARRLKLSIEDRCIVTRKRATAISPFYMPRYKGYNLTSLDDRQASTLLLVDPTIWYFDPDSRVHTMNTEWRQNPIAEALTTLNAQAVAKTRRTLFGFCIDQEISQAGSLVLPKGWRN